MIKKILPLLFLACSTASFAQQPQVSNSSFENWTAGAPDSFFNGHYVFSSLGTVTQSTDAHSGSSSVLLENKYEPLLQAVLPATMGYGEFGISMGLGWPFVGRPSKMKFWYKFTSVGLDSVQVSFMPKKWNAPPIGTPIAFGNKYITSSASNWTLAEIPISYFQSYNPDSLFLQFIVGSTTPALGSKFWIDDIQLEYTSGIEEPAQGSLVKFYPNPIQGSFTAELPQQGHFSIRVMDVTGKLVYSAAELDTKTTVNCRQWTAGMYIVQVTTDNRTYTEKLYLN